MVTKVDERIEVKIPKFRDPSELSKEQLTDPDYGLKKIARDVGISENEILVCSKCHHCR